MQSQNEYALFNAFANATTVVSAPVRLSDMTNVGVTLTLLSGTMATASALEVEQSNDGVNWTKTGITQPTAADFNGKTAPNFIAGTATLISMRFARGRLTGASGGVVANLTMVPYRS